MTARKASRLGLHVNAPDLDAATVGQVLTEGALLARYRYTALKAKNNQEPLSALFLKSTGHEVSAVQAGVAVGLVGVRATTIARDLANTPPNRS